MTFGRGDQVFRVEGWAPIPIIQVDVDAIENLSIDQAGSGNRVWVELTKRGQVVGVVEATADRGRVTSEQLERLSRGVAVAELPLETVSYESLPTATVVVPTVCHDPQRLQRTVMTILKMNYPDFDVIVVDNRPNVIDEPLPTFPAGVEVRMYRETRRGVSFARNCGIAHAKGEIVAFTDDDVEVDQNWLLELGRRFVVSPEVDAIGGLVLPMELRTQPQLWFEEFFGGFNQSFVSEVLSMELLSATDEMFPYSPGRFGAGCNMALRRSALERNGGFDITLGTGTPARGGEDLALFMKQVLTGGTVAFEARAVVRHQHRDSQSEFLNQVFGYGTGLTAMFTALILQDPRHLGRMVRRLPGAYRILTKPRQDRSPSTAPSYPRSAYLQHFLGMAYGPMAYLRSVLRSRIRV